MVPMIYKIWNKITSFLRNIFSRKVLIENIPKNSNIRSEKSYVKIPPKKDLIFEKITSILTRSDGKQVIILRPGLKITDSRGRTYKVFPDGSWRNVRPKLSL